MHEKLQISEQIGPIVDSIFKSVQKSHPWLKYLGNVPLTPETLTIWHQEYRKFKPASDNLAQPVVYVNAQKPGLIELIAAKTPVLLVVSGPTGSGQTTTVERTIKQMNAANDPNFNALRIITTTTRAVRETDESVYIHVNTIDFLKLIFKQRFAEHNLSLWGDWYGTLKESIKQELSIDKKILFLILDNAGARNILPYMNRHHPNIPVVRSFIQQDATPRELITSVVTRRPKKDWHARSMDAFNDIADVGSRVDFDLLILNRKGMLEQTVAAFAEFLLHPGTPGR